VSFFPRYLWPDSGRVESSPIERVLTVTATAEALLQDPAWDDIEGNEPRRDRARHLLAVRWAVKHGRLHERRLP
jgi:hypothetical protein